MIDPKNLSIKNYTYDLAESRIAKYPLDDRDASRLLVYKGGTISEDNYRNICTYLPPNSLLVFNDTKVIQARLYFEKATGGVIEIFCLEPDDQYADITAAMTQREAVLWRCLIGGASKWKRGQVLEKKITLQSTQITLHAKYIEKRSDCFVIEFVWHNQEVTFAEILHVAGAIPLPPYLKREAESIDEKRYQTIYAHHEGSVAAPTAGLHFTDNVLDKLRAKKIQVDFVTLHVGAGTFKPVKSEKLDKHEMHAEFINVSKASITHLLKNLSGNIIPIGTTSLRVVESLYWLGVKIRFNLINDYSHILISQWECYDLERFNLSPSEALQTLIDFMIKKDKERILMWTQLLIAPSYQVKIANALITNFHQPQSTLLLLVAAVIGEDWRRVYNYALENDFRFLSYGDGCLLWFKRGLGTLPADAAVS